MADNFPNLARDINLTIQEAEEPKQDNPKESQAQTHHNYTSRRMPKVGSWNRREMVMDTWSIMKENKTQ